MGVNYHPCAVEGCEQLASARYCRSHRGLLADQVADGWERKPGEPTLRELREQLARDREEGADTH